MTSRPLSLARIVELLRKRHGEPESGPARTAFELIVWENVAYLVDEARRAAAWDRLRERVGLEPTALAAAGVARIEQALAGSGLHVPKRARRLHESAVRVLDEYGGDLDAVLRGPRSAARRALKRFPAIGDPGADKILLLTGTAPVLALDSNGLRVLLRLGHGSEAKSYATSYRSAQRALDDQIGDDVGRLVAAHLLLRRHGQEVCRRTRPQCAGCALVRPCRWRAGA